MYLILEPQLYEYNRPYEKWLNTKIDINVLP